MRTKGKITEKLEEDKTKGQKVRAVNRRGTLTQHPRPMLTRLRVSGS